MRKTHRTHSSVEIDYHWWFPKIKKWIHSDKISDKERKTGFQNFRKFKTINSARKHFRHMGEVLPNFEVSLVHLSSAGNLKKNGKGAWKVKEWVYRHGTREISP